MDTRPFEQTPASRASNLDRQCRLRRGNRLRKSEGRAQAAVVALTAVAAMMALGAFLVWLPAGGSVPKEPARGESILRATLDNGLRVVIVRNPLAPVATTVINYLVGSDEAPEGFPGTAHAIEHMMFRGSPGLSADQLANITAALGGNFDADTQQVVTQYYFTIPAEELDVALHIEAIRMQSLSSSEELWNQERGAIEQEVAQDLSNPDYVFYTKLLEAMFRGTPYAHDALGTRPSFDQSTDAMLRNFHDTWYSPNNAILVIVGDLQPAKTLAEVKKLFGDLPAKKLPERPAIHLSSLEAQRLRLPTDSSTGLAVVAFRLPGSESDDYAATEVLADVLSSQRGSLYALVPEGKALSAGFSVSALPQAGVGYAAAAFPKGGDGEALVKQVRNILEDDLRQGVPTDLVEAAKRQELAGAEFEKNSVSGLAMAWSEALAVEGRQSPDDLVRAIEKVTVEDVNRVARKYLDLDHNIVAILTPEPSGKPVTSQAFGGKESFAPSQTKAVQLPSWAEQAAQRVSLPSTSIHPVVTTLANGLTLIVQPESISNTVSLFGHIRNNPDLETPRGKDGVDSLLNQLFSYGTTSLDRISFQKALDDIAAQESAGTGFSLQLLADQFDRGVELLADNELHPALPEEAVQIVRKQTAAAVAGRLESPDYLSTRGLQTALLPENDPALRQATPETISSLTIQDVRDYFQHVFRPDLTTIVVMGQITPEKAKEVVNKYFGGWKAAGPKPETLLPRIPLNRPSTLSVPNKSRVQDKVTLAVTLGLTRSDPDYYALELGNHILGGAFYATRLYRDLREKSGLVYYVSSAFQVGRTRGFYLVDYACDPPNVSKARAIVEQNLKQMQTQPVTADELRQAKAQLMREIPLSESSVDSIAAGLVFRSTNDLPLDEPIRAARLYLEFSATQVQSAFAKWLHPADFVQVSEGPSPQ